MITKTMSTSEKRKGMQTDMPELQAMISQRIQEQNYREVLKWCTDDPCVFRTAAGNLWIAVGHVNRKSEVPKFSYKNFLCAYLLGNAEDEVAAYLDLQAAAWKGVELVMFSSHADGLSALYGDGRANDRDLLYRFFGRNYVFAVASAGDKIFIASVDAVGFGEIDKDGKLAVINKIMSYEQFFDDEDLKPMGSACRETVHLEM